MPAIDRLLADCKTMDDFGEMLSEDDIDQIHDGNRVARPRPSGNCSENL